MRVRPALSVLFAMAMLGATARSACARQVGPLEERIFRAVNDAPHTLRAPVWLVMQAGSLGAVFGAAWALRARNDPRARRVLIAGATAWSSVKVIKPLVRRGRPAENLDHVNVRGSIQSGLGYPSGHAAVAVTLAVVTTPAGGPLRGVAAASAVAVGVARMYVGAHLPLDVVGGLATGVTVAAIANEIGPRTNRRSDQ